MAQDDGKGTEEGYVAASHQSASLPLSSAKSDSNSVRGWLQGEINTDQTLMQFTGYCLLTGLTSAPVFSACFIWPGFQTGNFVQLSLAVARLFAAQPRDYTFEVADRQALTSLLSFLLGASFGRVGDWIGPRRRLWVVGSTLLQALLVMAAALCVHYSGEGSLASGRGDPVWTSVLGFATVAFASASLGLHGIVAKRVNSQFGTAVVLTTVWVELICDPGLVAPHLVKTRDHRLVAVLGLFLGGLFGAALVHTIGSAGTFGVVAGVRVASAASWAVVPPKKATTRGE